MRVIYKNMRNSSNDLVVLNNWTSAHALNDAAAFCKQPFIGDADHHALGACFCLPVDFFNFDAVLFDPVAVYGCQDIRRPFFYFVLIADLKRLLINRIDDPVICFAENTKFCV